MTHQNLKQQMEALTSKRGELADELRLAEAELARVGDSSADELD